MLHAALGVVPAFFLIAAGHLTVGIAFAIGLLPTSLMDIAPRRKLRLVYGIVGCLFGLGILLGALIIKAHDVFETAFLFLVICYVATVLASRRPVGTLLLGILIPSLGIGTGYGTSRPTACSWDSPQRRRYSSGTTLTSPIQAGPRRPPCWSSGRFKI